MLIRVRSGLGEVAASGWDALVPPNDPFTTHAFLSTLEESGSVSPETGWQPLHLVIERQGQLIAAAPLYLKGHSYGEYIFDWGWARAAEGAGIPYYPKLSCAVPFTPATGSRLLVHPDEADPAALRRLLVQGMRSLADQTRASSIHLLFLPEAELEATEGLRFTPRLSHQYHWESPGVASFEAWLGLFRHHDRKEARRERRRPADQGAIVRVVPGAELSPRQWAALEGFYRSTVDRKWGEAYLSPAFFALAPTRLAHLALGILAEVDGEPVAGSLLFQRGAHLYGRYWGCKEGYEKLHFELCYHKPIELCIERGWTRFEAGAQGDHKLKRGLLPSATRSAHWLRDPGLADAVRRAVQQETVAVTRQMEALASHGPFRVEPQPGP